MIFMQFNATFIRFYIISIWDYFRSVVPILYDIIQITNRYLQMVYISRIVESLKNLLKEDKKIAEIRK